MMTTRVRDHRIGQGLSVCITSVLLGLPLTRCHAVIPAGDILIRMLVASVLPRDSSEPVMCSCPKTTCKF